MDKTIELIDASKTAFHAVEQVRLMLEADGFTRLDETSDFAVKRGGKYYVTRNGSALIALKVGDYKLYSHNIVAAHTDSPCFKLKNNPIISAVGCEKLNVERYGGAINYSFLDSPLRVCGRVIAKEGNTLKSKLFSSEKQLVIPSVAIHFNRTVNDGIKLNAQTDMCPLASFAADGDRLIEEIKDKCGDAVASDLFLISDEKPFVSGFNDQFITSPRLDNLASVFCAARALISAEVKNVGVLYIADNEEVGSQTKQGAGGTFLKDTLTRLAEALGENVAKSLPSTILFSADNAHAAHINHAELSDPTNQTTLGKGVVIKHHANQNYTTDALSDAFVETALTASNIDYQHFFMRSDLQCGGTLGAISSAQLSIKSADLGLPQLAMHSARETCAAVDLDNYLSCFKCLFSTPFKQISDGEIQLL